MTAVAPPVTGSDTAIFEELESGVRVYCRQFPAVFHRAEGARVFTEDGQEFIDFFCGASAVNYGHNNRFIKARIAAYLAEDGIVQGLDMYTVAKREFLTTFAETVLRPRGLDYKVQCCGPTGTDAVEAALKLARKVTGRRGIVAFSGAYHGMSRGSLAVTADLYARRAGDVPAQDVTFLPFEDGPLGPFDSIPMLERLLDDPGSGVERPAAVIVEPVQMHGGVYPASAAWLRRLRAVTARHGVLLICDDIQSGCGRTGTFFGFEHAGITPDIVAVAKSIGGYGMPMALSLFRRELDVWAPGEHSSTFLGNQLAFVAAGAACELWQQPAFQAGMSAAATRLDAFRDELRHDDPGVVLRGRGLILAIDLGAAGGAERAARVQRSAFDRGVIIDRSGRHDEVVKILPPLTIDIPLLDRGLGVLRGVLRDTPRSA